MAELDVRIERLDTMRVISTSAYGTTPESEAWDKLRTYAEPKGILLDPEKNRTYGFNNPDPTPGKAKYGYEIWLEVGEDFQPDGDMAAKEIPGGMYAVTRCTGVSNIFPTWQLLHAWCKQNNHKCSEKLQWMERSLNYHDCKDEESLVMDLYYPIAD